MLNTIAHWRYLWQETLRGLARGGWLNWAAIATVSVSLFLLGASVQASGHVERTIERFGSQLEISVYLQPLIRANDLRAKIAQVPGVSDLTIIPREKAWRDLVRDLGIADIDQATQQLEGNPLVDEIKVKAASATIAPQLANRLRQIPGVSAARYVDEVLARLRDLDRLLDLVSGGITALLVSAAIATTITTIRLVVAARQEEIEIAQLVGATRSWIYLPFLLQGLFFGIIGATIAVAAIVLGQEALASILSSQPAFLQFIARELPLTVQELLSLFALLLAMGGGIGLLSSILAVRRTRLASDRPF